MKRRTAFRLADTQFNTWLHEGESMSQHQGFSHIVFFTVADPTPENVSTIVSGCHKYLDEHDGCTYFSVGTLADEMKRDVNDRDFHVSLHVMFATAGDHDGYQVHPRHLQFIDEHKHLWSGVRVFDSHLTER